MSVGSLLCVMLDYSDLYRNKMSTLYIPSEQMYVTGTSVCKICKNAVGNIKICTTRVCQHSLRLFLADLYKRMEGCTRFENFPIV